MVRGRRRVRQQHVVASLSLRWGREIGTHSDLARTERAAERENTGDTWRGTHTLFIIITPDAQAKRGRCRASSSWSSPFTPLSGVSVYCKTGAALASPHVSIEREAAPAWGACSNSTAHRSSLNKACTFRLKRTLVTPPRFGPPPTASHTATHCAAAADGRPP